MFIFILWSKRLSQWTETFFSSYAQTRMLCRQMKKKKKKKKEERKSKKAKEWIRNESISRETISDIMFIIVLSVYLFIYFFVLQLVAHSFHSGMRLVNFHCHLAWGFIDTRERVCIIYSCCSSFATRYMTYKSEYCLGRGRLQKPFVNFVL